MCAGAATGSSAVTAPAFLKTNVTFRTWPGHSGCLSAGSVMVALPTVSVLVAAGALLDGVAGADDDEVAVPEVVGAEDDELGVPDVVGCAWPVDSAGPTTSECPATMAF